MMPEFREDLDIYPLIVELVACVCAELEASGLPAVCRCAPMPGSAPVIDFSGTDGCKDGCGQAWVRLINAFPSDDFPAPGFGVNTRCEVALAYLLEVGVSRCEPVGKTVAGKFTPPTMEDQLGAVRLYTADMQAMRRAILCCFRGEHEDDVEVAVGTYSPLDSIGGVGGGTWQIAVRRI